MSEIRTPFDGRPYYCVSCGCAWGEFMACDDIDCHLETDAVAQQRRVARLLRNEVLETVLEAKSP